MGVTTLEHRTVKARKMHKCDLCRQPIIAGLMYERQANAYDGSVYTWRNHMYCAAICDMFFDSSDHYEGYGPYDFDEDMSQSWHDAEFTHERGGTYPFLTKGWEV